MEEFKQSLVDKTKQQIHKIIDKLLRSADIPKIKYAVEISNYSNFRRIMTRPRLHELFPLVLANSSHQCECDDDGPPPKTWNDVLMTCRRLLAYAMHKLSFEHFVLLYHKISPNEKCVSFTLVYNITNYIESIAAKQKYMFENSHIPINSRIKIIMSKIDSRGDLMIYISHLTNHMYKLSDNDITTIISSHRYPKSNGVFYKQHGVADEYRIFMINAAYRLPYKIDNILSNIATSITCDWFHYIPNKFKMILINTYADIITLSNNKPKFEFNMFKYPAAAKLILLLQSNRNIYEVIPDELRAIDPSIAGYIIQYICNVLPVQLICDDFNQYINNEYKFGDIDWWRAASMVPYSANRISEETFQQILVSQEPWKLNYNDNMFEFD